MSRHTFAQLLVATALLGSAPNAHAEERKWYGWQPMLTDGAALTVGAVSLKAERPGPGLMTSFGMFVVGSPIIHAAHGNWGRAGISFGARAALPVIGGGLGGFIASAGDDRGMSGSKRAIGGALLGGIVGVVSAMAVDYALLSYKSTEPTMVPVMSLGGAF